MNKVVAAAAGTVVVSACSIFSAAEAGTALDANLYAQWTVSDTGANALFCGSVGSSSGCYGSAQLGPFEKACAFLDGEPKTKNSVITRNIYVLDKRVKATSPVTLYIYQRTDTINESFDSIDVHLVKQVPLGIAGASGKCKMAADPDFIFAGTDTTQMVRVDKRTEEVQQYSVVPLSLTADDRGYIAVTEATGFGILGPNGVFWGSGGGSAVEFNTRNAYVPK